jgi:hypothetical protein
MPPVSRPGQPYAGDRTKGRDSVQLVAFAGSWCAAVLLANCAFQNSALPFISPAVKLRRQRSASSRPQE